MPRGPLPKDDSKRQRRNEPTFQAVELEPGAAVAAPALREPKKRLAPTRRWWQTWVGAPQAAQFLATDWERLQMLALVVDDFYRAKSAAERKGLLAEIRAQEAKLGATPEDRLRLRWRMPAVEREEDRGETVPARRSARSRRDPRLQLVEGGSK